MNERARQKLTPPQIAEKWGIGTTKVLSWIRSGELPAIDASTRRGGRPRYLVDVEDLADFEVRRAVLPSKPQSPKRKPTPSRVTNYF